MLKELGIAPDVVGARSATWCHRRDGDTDIYFVAADRLSSLDANLRFRATGRPEFWDPVTGASKRVAVYDQDAAGTTIPIQLPAAGSVFVVFHPGEGAPAWDRILVKGQPWLDATDRFRVDTAEPFPHFGLSRDVPLQPWIEPAPLVGEVLGLGRQFLAWNDGEHVFSRRGAEPVTRKVTGTRSIPLSRGWSLSFPAGWDAPALIDMGEVKPWSELEDKAARHFSGSATYRTRFALDAVGDGERAWLDLGRVGDIAVVRVNGEVAATLWTAPFRVDITAHVRPGDNELEVEVTNTWRNRLAYDAGLPGNQQKTWTLRAPEADAPVELAGLAGPVLVRIGQVVSAAE